MQNNEKDGVLLPPTAADIETALKKERDVTAVLITSPDYYGNVADLSAIEKVCRRYNRIFMVDGAHGAYLKFDADARGLYAGECAHIWVDGSHKTMPTLTQGALLNVNDESLLADAAEGLNMFRTTSPSYPVMASIEYGVKYMEENGAALIDAVRRELTLVKAKLRKAGIPFYAFRPTARKRSLRGGACMRKCATAGIFSSIFRRLRRPCGCGCWNSGSAASRACAR